jgi:hypothetical protein
LTGVYRVVCIVLVAADVGGPSTWLERIPVFQRLQFSGSDHSAHARSGEAVVDRLPP